jgi:hypothetical protein
LSRVDVRAQWNFSAESGRTTPIRADQKKLVSSGVE